MTRYFVTATDTSVGKTEVSLALLRLMVAQGLAPKAYKPFESAGDDGDRLHEVTRAWQERQTVSLYRFKRPLAPAIAARLARKKTSWRKVLSTFGDFGDAPCVVEGAGGLHVPLDASHDVIDLIDALKLPVVVVARAGLGTVNHTVLTLASLAAHGAQVRAVVLNQPSPGRDPSVAFNRRELERRFPSVNFIGPVKHSASVGLRQRALQAMLRAAGLP
jgi:dethiobiotin synthetase